MFIILLCGEFLPKAEDNFKKELQNALFSILHLVGDKAISLDPLKQEGDTLKSVSEDVHLRVCCHASYADLLDLIPSGAAANEQILIAFVGACTEGGAGQWVLKDCLVDSKLLARKIAEGLIRNYDNQNPPQIDAVGDTAAIPLEKTNVNIVVLSSEKNSSAWTAFPQQVQEIVKTHVHIDLSMKSFEQSLTEEDFAHSVSISMTHQVMEKMHPLPVFDRLPSSSMNGCVNFSRPTLYVFPEGDGNAAFFGVPGYNLLIDGGFSLTPTFWNFVRCCYGLNSMLLTNWSASNLLGPHSFLERIASSADEHAVKDNGHSTMEDPLSRMHQFGLLHPPGPSHSSHTKLSPDSHEGDLNLDLNISQWANHLLSSFVKPHFHLSSLELVGAKVLTAAPRCIPLYQNWTIGNLELFVLNPLEDEAELKKFLAEWSKEKEKFSTSPVNPSKQVLSLLQCMSLCVLLVWKPTDPQAHVTRLLFPGNCPQSRVLLSLNAAQGHLSYLKYPLGKPSPSVVTASKLSVPRKLSPASSKRGSIGSLGSKSGSGIPASSKAVSSSTDKKPTTSHAKGAHPPDSSSAARVSTSTFKKPAVPNGKKESATPSSKVAHKKETSSKPTENAPKVSTETTDDSAHLTDVHLAVTTATEEELSPSVETKEAPPVEIESEHHDVPQQQLTREQMREMGIFDDGEEDVVEYVSSQEDLVHAGDTKIMKPVEDHHENIQNGVHHSGDQSPSDEHLSTDLKHPTEFEPTATWGQPMNLPPADDVPSTKSASSGGKSGSSKPSSASAKAGSSTKLSTKTAGSSPAAPATTTPRRTTTGPSSGSAGGSGSTTGRAGTSTTSSAPASAGSKRPGGALTAPPSASAKNEDKGSNSSRTGASTKPTSGTSKPTSGTSAGTTSGAKSARTPASASATLPGKAAAGKGHAASGTGDHHAHPVGTSVASGHGALNKSPPYDKLIVSYVDCAYIPAAGDPHFVDVEFFKRVRSRYYILSCLEPTEETLDALLIGKESWGETDGLSKVSLIPTYDSPALLRWVARNIDRLQKAQIEIEPSASKCIIELEDVQTHQKDASNVATAYRISL